MKRRPRLTLDDREEFLEFATTHNLSETARFFNMRIGSIHGYLKKWAVEGVSTNRGGLTLPDKLTLLQEEVLIGSLLGDGTLSKVSSVARNSAYGEGHGNKQKDYLLWKQDIFKSFISSFGERLVPKLFLIDRKIHRDYNDLHVDWFLQTYSHLIFTKLERKWYLRDADENYILNNLGRRIKVVPKDLRLTPLICAVWFGDDGSNQRKEKRVSFATDGFTLDECEFLASLLLSLGFKFYVYKNHRIGIASSDYYDFIKMMSDALLSIGGIPVGMEYKFDLSLYKPALDHWTPKKAGGREMVKLCEQDVREIFELKNKGVPSKDIASVFDIHPRHICSIITGKKWGHLDIPLREELNKKGLNKGNQSGTKGVSFSNNQKKWIATVHLNGSPIHLGAFIDKEDAISIMNLANQLKKDGEQDIEKYKNLKFNELRIYNNEDF